MNRLACIITLVLFGCSGPPPERTVYTFFEAMSQGDANRLALVLDSTIFSGASKALELDTLFARAGYEARRNRILLELTGGELKRRWLSKQVIVGRTEKKGDTSFVEVSFVDPQTAKHYLTNFVLIKKQNRWVISSFR